MIRVLAMSLAVVALGARAAAAQCDFKTTGTKDVVAAQLAYASSPTPTTTAALAEALAETFENTVKVDAVTRVALTLTNPPAERLRVSFDTAGGAHREVEWDPAVSSALSREVRLEPDTWTISVTVEPQTFNQSNGTVIIRARFGKLVAGARTSIDGAYVAMGIAAGGTPTSTALTAWPRPRLTLVCNAAPSQAMDAVQFATSVTTSAADGSVRGLGVAPAIVADTLALLAEIAVDRARAGALDVLRRRLVDPFCVDRSTRVSLRRVGLGASGELALPRTCELLRSLRLDDVLASGRPLLIALRDDLRFTIAPAVALHLARGDVRAERALGGVVSIINAAIDRGGFDVLQAQLALELFTAVEHAGTALVPIVKAEFATQLAVALARQPAAATVALAAVLGVPCAGSPCTPPERDAAAAALVDAVAGGWRWTDAATATAAREVLTAAVDAVPSLATGVAYGCQARLVVAIVKRCSGGGCTAGDLTAMVTRPGDYFTLDTALPAALCWRNGAHVAVPADLAAVQRLVIDGLALVAPVVEGQGRERARAAVRLIAQLVSRAAGDETARKVTAFSDLAVAVIDEDYGTAFGRFLSLVEVVGPPTPQHRVVRRFAQLIGAVASYAVVYRQTKDDDPQAARDARKRALSSILDAFTDRTERGDEWIVSLGANVGLSFTDRRVKPDGGTALEPALRVPLGVRVEWLRRPDAGWTGFGGYGALQLVDLGQFIRRDQHDALAAVSWADFVALGVELGLSAPPSLARELSVSVHGSYAPSVEHATSNGVVAGTWSWGVSLNYYVPFFDVN